MELKLLELSKDFDISDDLKRAQAQVTARQIVEWLGVMARPFDRGWIVIMFTPAEWQELRRAAGMEDKCSG